MIDHQDSIQVVGLQEGYNWDVCPAGTQDPGMTNAHGIKHTDNGLQHLGALSPNLLVDINDALLIHLVWDNHNALLLEPHFCKYQDSLAGCPARL